MLPESCNERSISLFAKMQLGRHLLLSLFNNFLGGQRINKSTNNQSLSVVCQNHKQLIYKTSKEMKLRLWLLTLLCPLACGEEACRVARTVPLIKTDMPPPVTSRTTSRAANSTPDSRMLEVGPGGQACDSLANLDTYDYWLFYDKAERVLNRPKKAVGHEKRMRIRRTEGHENLRGVRCTPIRGARGINVRWQCADMHSGNDVAGAVKWEGCHDRHDPQFFTVGSAYFKPHPVAVTFFDRRPELAGVSVIAILGLLGWFVVAYPIMGEVVMAIVKLGGNIAMFCMEIMLIGRIFGVGGGDGSCCGGGSFHDEGNSFGGYASDDE